mmetsp:Transcript_39020/g.96923  ORF Transcript_39020/g.96923 Transcript_39020/m.96923 type:complete len:81 (-) Transcript_39020:264-506(-)
MHGWLQTLLEYRAEWSRCAWLIELVQFYQLPRPCQKMLPALTPYRSILYNVTMRRTAHMQRNAYLGRIHRWCFVYEHAVF